MPRRKTQDLAPEYFTTFQVAKMLHVSPPTVVNWVNSGLLTAHRTPGGHRRIAKADIVAFAKANEYPVPSFGPAAPTQIPLLPRTPPPPPPSKRVLIVDDLPEFCMLVREYLVEVGGYEVELAFSGFAAGLIVARFRPELILLDINLDPHNSGAMDGFEVLKLLELDPETRAIPVIACTGTSDSRVADQVRRGTLYAHLEKPFPLAQLADMVAEALAGATPPAYRKPTVTASAALRV